MKNNNNNNKKKESETSIPKGKWTLAGKARWHLSLFTWLPIYTQMLPLNNIDRGIINTGKWLISRSKAISTLLLLFTWDNVKSNKSS